jgi:hypothetical protein
VPGDWAEPKHAAPATAAGAGARAAAAFPAARDLEGLAAVGYRFAHRLLRREGWVVNRKRGSGCGARKV